MARIAYSLYTGKFLNSVSVGFIPIRWEDGLPDSPFSIVCVGQFIARYGAREMAKWEDTWGFLANGTGSR